MNEIEEETHTGKGQAINTDSLADNRDSPSSGCPRVFPSLTRFVDFFIFFNPLATLWEMLPKFLWAHFRKRLLAISFLSLPSLKCILNRV